MKCSLLIVTTVFSLASLAFGTMAVPPVILTEQGVKNLGLETVTVEETDFEIATFALGRTEAIPENRAVLSSRAPGRVIENRLKIGMPVKKDEPLVLLESRLPGDPPPSIWLKSPISGTIISVRTKLGSPVEPSDSLAEIADLNTLYLIAKLPQATAGKIKQGTQAKVRFPVRPDREYTANLLQLKSYLCPDQVCGTGQDVATRSTPDDAADLNTAGVIFTIDNPENILRPDMNAECSIIMEKRQGVLSVPREALQGSSANRHVYVKHMSIPHAFDRVPVQTGISSNERVEIIDGLMPGDEVVTRGSYSLGFAGSSGGPSLKEAMDAAHGHEHNEDGSEKTADSHAEDDHDEHDHAREPQGTSPREMFFIASTVLLALLLVLNALRRRSAESSTSELS